jgi:ribosome biogenesis protein ERB1
MSIHPSGDHVILGGEDRRVCWFDLDLSTKPYKALRYHDAAVRGVAFHPTYPLFASASDDGTAHVFHGKVFSDLMTNPMIVPVKILKGHEKSKAGEGVCDVVFHPGQPWCFTAGADGKIYLYVNP